MAGAGSGIDRFRAFLRDRSLRVTEVRERVALAVLQRHGHFDVDEVVAELRRGGTRASRATVYRALPLLEQAGLIAATTGQRERQRYERALDRRHHDHLVCTRCKRVVEFEYPAFEILQHKVAEMYGFLLTSHTHQLFGLCPACRRREGASRVRHR
ncbi:MAG: transcriptional repressor [Deltaproteobacteria bacterium]|nr:transcriptional repressor [Deltaproteobacteria bacterium]